jgi:hypothetical protein
VRSISKLSAGGHSGRNGDRRVSQPQRVRGQDGRRWPRIAAPRQNVEDDIGGMDAVGERFGAGRLHRGKAVSQHRRQDLDHLPIAVVRALQLAPNTLQAGWQQPVFERGTVAQCAGLLGEHWHVMPGIVGRLAAAEASSRHRQLGICGLPEGAMG